MRPRCTSTTHPWPGSESSRGRSRGLQGLGAYAPYQSCWGLRIRGCSHVGFGACARIRSSSGGSLGRLLCQVAHHLILGLQDLVGHGLRDLAGGCGRRGEGHVGLKDFVGVHVWGRGGRYGACAGRSMGHVRGAVWGMCGAQYGACAGQVRRVWSLKSDRVQVLRSKAIRCVMSSRHIPPPHPEGEVRLEKCISATSCCKPATCDLQQ